MQNNEKYLFVVSGPAGVGKDSVVFALRDKYPEIERSVTATTRAPRPNEMEGVNYYYLTMEAFQKLREENGVLEWNFYCQNYYGTLRSDVERRLNEGKVVVLVIDVNGAEKLKAMYPGATTVFIAPPSLDELEKRLRGRATETEESIVQRLAQAKVELEIAKGYDEIFVNEQVDSAVELLHDIILKHIS